jgi:hypothetical protein
LHLISKNGKTEKRNFSQNKKTQRRKATGVKNNRIENTEKIEQRVYQKIRKSETDNRKNYSHGLTRIEKME